MSKPSEPYQPFLFRVLHGLTALCLILAILTAFWTYNTYDGRWVHLPLPDYREIEGIHGTFGLYTLLIFPAFVHYAFRRGYQRLIQPDSFDRLQQVGQMGQPIWWYTLNRFVNTLALLALTFALFSGKMMDSTWLPKGELHHLWYTAHLVSWGGMVSAIALHLLLNARVGGVPWLRSVWRLQLRAKDSPRRWPRQVAVWWAKARPTSWLAWWTLLAELPRLETAILVSILLAWVISLAKEIAQQF